MNAPTSTVLAPPPPKRLEDMKLPIVMMRDIILKTMFRKNTNIVTDLARTVCLPVTVTQELIDMCRGQGLMEAMGTLGPSGKVSSEMPYQLTDSGKARALDALAQSEYFGAMPIPLDVLDRLWLRMGPLLSEYYACAKQDMVRQHHIVISACGNRDPATAREAMQTDIATAREGIVAYIRSLETV